MTKGVIVGKFYPLHLGHQYLIETALSQVEQLTVIVVGKKGQIIAPEIRAEWIRSLYPKIKVLPVLHNLPAKHDEKWAKATVGWAGFKPDIFFTSEVGEENYCKIMGAKLVEVDVERKKFPISGTLVREKPLEYFNLLSPIVRAYFVRRISIVGAESTGSTTLASELAKKFKTSWVCEFGRYYWEGKMTSKYVNWDHSEFEYIARARQEMENELAGYANKVLFCDTDALSTYIWEEFFCKKGSEDVKQFFRESNYDMTFVTDVDIPFVNDGVRVAENRRKSMHKQFLKLLEAEHKKFMVISGPLDKRIDNASKIVDEIVKSYKIEEKIL